MYPPFLISDDFLEVLEDGFFLAVPNAVVLFVVAMDFFFWMRNPFLRAEVLADDSAPPSVQEGSSAKWRAKVATFLSDLELLGFYLF